MELLGAKIIFTNWMSENYPNFDDKNFLELESDMSRASYVMDMINFANNPVLNYTQEQNEELAEAYMTGGHYHFNRKEFVDALKKYEKAKLLVTANSRQCAFCLGQMARCYIFLKKKGFALAYLLRALKCTKIDKAFKLRLDPLRAELENYFRLSREETVNSCPNEPVLLSPSTYLTSASKKVAMSSNEHRQFLRATADVSVGEVLMVEEPYAHVLVPELRRTHCWNCYKECQDECLPCTVCNQVVFCGVYCLEEAKEIHDFECPILGLLFEVLEGGSIELLALRVLLIASKCGKKIEDLKKIVDNINSELEQRVTYDSHDFIRIYDLKNYSEVTPSHILLLMAFVSGCIVSELKERTNFFEEAPYLQGFACGILLRCIFSTESNGDDIRILGGEYITDIGKAFYATYSLLNHSCDPNVEIIQYNKNIVVRSIKPIKVGDELFTCFGVNYATLSYEQRHFHLQENHVPCNCTPCEENWPIYPSLPAKPECLSPDKEIRARFRRLRRKFRDNFHFVWLAKEEEVEVITCLKLTSEVLEDLCTYLEFLDKYVRKPCKEYVNCQQAIKNGYLYVPGFQRGVSD